MTSKNNYIVGVMSGITASSFFYIIMYWLNYISLEKSLLKSILSGFSILFMLFGFFLFGISFFEKKQANIKQSRIWGTLLGILAIIAAVWVIYDVLTYNRGLSSLAKLLWILFAIFFSIITAIVYFFVYKVK